MTDTLLPDVSEFQAGASAPDWAGIRRQNGGAGIIRVGYGTSHLDHMFTANYTAMKQLAFPFTGLYHYIVATQPITAQARAFCAWIGPPSAVAPGTVFIADLEEGTGNQLDRATAWLGRVDHYYGLDRQPLPRRSWLYSGASFAVSQGLAPVFSSARRTWVAAYSAVEPRLGHTLWQSTDGSAGSHITAWAGCGRVDTSVYHGTLAQLAAMGWPRPGAPPARPDVPATPTPRPRKEADMIIVKVTPPAGHSWTGTRTFLYAPGADLEHIVSGADNAAFGAALPTVAISWNQYTGMGGT